MSDEQLIRLDGWAVRDGETPTWCNRLFFHEPSLPKRHGWYDIWAGTAPGTHIELDSGWFPDLAWEDEPIPITLTIERREP